LIRGGEDTFLELKVKLSNSEKIAQEIVALANTGGGVMIFGVNDQMRIEGVDDPESVQEELVRICREDIEPALVPFIDRIAFDNGRRVVALDIEGKRRPYRNREGRFYLRIGSEKREASREELSALLDEARPLGFENLPVIGATTADIDEAHLWSFLREFEGDASDNAVATGYPTVNATRFAGDSLQSPIIERISIAGNLLTLYEATLRFVARYADLWETRPKSFPASEVADSPVAARGNYERASLCEAVCNLLIHRDLALRDQPSRLNIFDHSIEIINPRRTSGFFPVAQKAIRYGVPQSLNPQLAAIFRSPAYGLKLPQGGLPMSLRASRLFSHRRTELNAINDEFRLRLHGI